MEVDMELSKKTTILFPPDLYEHLARLASQRRTSVGQLVRDACEVQYRRVPVDQRLGAVAELGRLSLPVADPETMKRESVPEPGEILR
jgi:hypothetical protein